MESLGTLFEKMGTPQPYQRFIFFSVGTYVLLQIVQPSSLYPGGVAKQVDVKNKQFLTPVTASLLSGVLFSVL